MNYHEFIAMCYKIKSEKQFFQRFYAAVTQFIAHWNELRERKYDTTVH